METATKQLESGIIKLSRDDGEFLGFKISSSSRPDVTVVRQERTRETGYIVRGSVIEEWQVAGRHEYRGRYIIGPWLAGRSLESRLDDSGPAMLALIGRVVAALRAARTQGIEIDEIDASAVYLLDDGGVLLLPGSISSRQRACISEAERRRGYEEINHPIWKGEANLCFSAAVLAYRAVSGEHPFRMHDEELPLEELRQRMRTGDFIPLRYAAPAVAADGFDELDQALATEDQSPGLEKMAELVHLLKGNLEAGETSSADRVRREGEAERLRRRLTRKRRAEGFLRRNRVRLIVGALILAVVGSVAGTIIGNALEPPVTRGMSPEEVTRLFYTSMNSFDHMTMEDCVAGDAGKGYIREAMNLYVISRMRQGYEQGRNPYVDVQKWIDAGRPPIDPEQALYGIGDLEIRQDGEAQFTVSYEKWIPNTPDTPDAVPENDYLGEKIVERVTLEQLKGVWRIVRIESLEREPLDPVQLRRKE